MLIWGPKWEHHNFSRVVHKGPVVRRSNSAQFYLYIRGSWTVTFHIVIDQDDPV